MAKEVSFTERNSILDRLFNSVARSIGGEPPFYIWPAPLSTPAECEFYLANEFLSAFYSALTALKNKGHGSAEIAKMLKAPSRIAQTLWPFGHTTDLSDAERQNLVDLALDIVELISTYRQDPFNDDGRNIIWSDSRVNEVILSHSFTKLEEMPKEQAGECRNLLAKLSGLAWLYCELLYFSIHEVGQEFHGPYDLEQNTVLLVKEYYDLRPEIWEFSGKLPYNKVRIMGIYEKVDINFDFFGRNKSMKPIYPACREFCITLDDDVECLGLAQIEQCIKALEEVSKIGSMEIARLPRLEVMAKFAQAYYFILKPLHERLGEQWLPPHQIYEDMLHDTKREIVERLYEGFRGMEEKPREESVEILSKLFDPRYRM